MTKEQFKESILKHANHDFEEAQHIYEDTGSCVWCNGDRTVPSGDDDTVKCPVCTLKAEESDMTGSCGTNER